MRVLIGCEESATVREAFAKLGHDAWSCDLLPSRIPGKHIQADILTVLNDGWDLAIFHTPCTYLSNSGVRWLYNKDGSRNLKRWELMERDALLFKATMEANIPMKANENPIKHLPICHPPHPPPASPTSPTRRPPHLTWGSTLRPVYGVAVLGSQRAKGTRPTVKGVNQIRLYWYAFDNVYCR